MVQIPDHFLDSSTRPRYPALTSTAQEGSMEIYADDTVSVWQGDARKLPVGDRTAALVVTSPPYNIGGQVDYVDVADDLSWSDYADLAWAAAGEMERILVPGGKVYLNAVCSVPRAPKAKDRESPSQVWADALHRVGLLYWDTIAWVSKRGAGTAWGSWQRPSSTNLRGDWETILVFYKESWARKAPAGFERWEDTLGGWTELVTNVWDIKPESRRRNGHPAPFPIEVPSRAIRLSTWPGELVVDPFCGSGNTLLAAKRLGRRGLGVDLSPTWSDLAARRCTELVLDTTPVVEASVERLFDEDDDVA